MYIYRYLVLARAHSKALSRAVDYVCQSEFTMIINIPIKIKQHSCSTALTKVAIILTIRFSSKEKAT